MMCTGSRGQPGAVSLPISARVGVALMEADGKDCVEPETIMYMHDVMTWRLQSVLAEWERRTFCL